MGVQDLHKLKGSHLSDRSNFAPRTNRFTCLVADGKNILLAREAKDENRQSLTSHGVFGSPKQTLSNHPTPTEFNNGSRNLELASKLIQPENVLFWK